MAIMLRRQLNDGEKAQILESYGRKCFATGHMIPPEESVHFDHIKSFAEGGYTDLANIAPMCEYHNKQKGTLPLEDFRVKIRLNNFFELGDTLTLKHLLQFLKDSNDISDFGRRVSVREGNGRVCIEHVGGQSDYELYECPTTGWKYFYATVPIELLDSDDEEDRKIGLQPRYLIQDKVFALYRHFQRHPVLQPSIGRIHQGRILLFDGQHKIAALLWNNRRVFECKIYLTSDLRLLNDTNIAAHDKFAQTRFYSSIMVQKLGTEFGNDFTEYRNLEDGTAKSESGFMKYLRLQPAHIATQGELNRRFRSYLYNAVLQDPDNRATKYVSNSNRSTDRSPLTIDMISKSLFSCFLFSEPSEDNMATDAYMRDREITNVVSLMNMLDDLALSSWNPKAGVNDTNQNGLVRLFRSKSIMAWSELLRDAVCGKLELQDSEDRARPFYRELSDEDLDKVKKVVERLVTWKMWSSPSGDDIDRILSDNKSAVRNWFKENGLTTGYLMGAPE